MKFTGARFTFTTMKPSEYLAKHMNIVSHTLNGKKLRPADLRLVAKLEEMGLGVLDDAISVHTTNPVSGYSDMLEPLVSALVNWTFETYGSYDTIGTGAMRYRGTKVTIQTYDRVRMLVLALDSKAYSNFRD